MAARDRIFVSCPVGSWTELTAGDVTTITFLVTGGSAEIRGETSATAPADAARGIPYMSGMGEANRTLSDLFHLTGVDRVFARPMGGDEIEIFVDHA